MTAHLQAHLLCTCSPCNHDVCWAERSLGQGNLLRPNAPMLKPAYLLLEKNNKTTTTGEKLLTRQSQGGLLLR